MKTIGLLGGMSWESTQTYYRLINQGIKTQLGGLHSAKVAMFSVDFAPLEKMQHEGDWTGISQQLCQHALQVEATGADCLLICTNTMHKVADDIQAALSIPLLHIADATALAVKQQKIESLGLLGTAFTMEQPFYKERLQSQHDLRVLTPNSEDRQLVHKVIYQELCLGKICPTSREEYLRIINDLAQRGAQGVILGCTEIALLIQASDSPIQTFDTTAIHAQAAVDFAIQELL